MHIVSGLIRMSFIFLVFQFFGQQECPSSNLNYDIGSDGSPRNCQFKDPVCMFNSFFYILNSLYIYSVRDPELLLQVKM